MSSWGELSAPCIFEPMRAAGVVLIAVAAAVVMACGGDEGDTGSGGDGGDTTSGPGGAPSTSASGGTTSSGQTAGGGGCSSVDGCYDYCSFTPTGNISFADDVMPIFEASCNSTNCHGSPSTPDADLYLGSASGNDEDTILEVYGELVNVDGFNALGMFRVKPGDPENSWLMVKLDGDMSCPRAAPFCAGSCGQRMPRGAGAMPLPDSELNIIRSWIANGAPSPNSF